MLRGCFQRLKVHQYKQEMWNFSSKETLTLSEESIHFGGKVKKSFQEKLEWLCIEVYNKQNKHVILFPIKWHQEELHAPVLNEYFYITLSFTCLEILQ